jgi:hypothetical protein
MRMNVFFWDLAGWCAFRTFSANGCTRYAMCFCPNHFRDQGKPDIKKPIRLEREKRIVAQYGQKLGEPR